MQRRYRWERNIARGWVDLPKQLPPQELPFHRGSVQAPLETVPGAESGCSRDDGVVKTHRSLLEQVCSDGQQDDTGDFTSHA